MKMKIIVEFDYEWMLSHREDEHLPADVMCDALNGQFDCRVDDKSILDLSLTVESGGDFEEIRKKICDIFTAKYGAENLNKIAVSLSEEDSDENGTIGGQNGKETTSAKEQGKREGEIDGSTTKSTKTGSDAKEGGRQADGAARRAMGRLFDRTSIDDDDDDAPIKPRDFSKEHVQELLKEIGSLVCGDALVSLAREIVKAAPEIKERKLDDVLLSRNYLFSISDGCGFSTATSLMAKLFNALGFECEEYVREIKMPPFNENRDKITSVLSALDGAGAGYRHTIVALDISEWMDRTTNGNFREVLKTIEAGKDNMTVFFRIPFVEQDCLERVSDSLNDVLTTRTLSFVPARREQIMDFAKSELKKRGFTVQRAALEQFWNRINEERSDGRFYGIKTVKKVLDELIYSKLVRSAKPGSNMITEKDAAAICKAENSVGKTAQEMLDALVGNEGVKDQINAIIAQIQLAKMTSEVTPCIHMRFVGNPGTGKTTVARIVGKMLREKGILRIGNFFEVSGRDFCGRYIGETAPKTASMCRDAYGSVLFIDEAYSLYRSGEEDSKDFGREALDTLIAEMENHRDDFVVIMAGYTDEMDKLMQGNRGLKSRMPYTIEFPNFTRDQLYEIFCSLVNSKFAHDDALLSLAKDYFETLPQELLDSKEFSNGRYVRNLYERTWAKAALRSQLTGLGDIVLTGKDFELATADKDFLVQGPKRARLGFYDK